MVQVQLPLPFSLGPLVKRSRHRPFTAVTGVRFPHGSPLGSLAQLGEHLPYKQRVSGSSPLTSTTKTTHESEWFFFLFFRSTDFPGRASCVGNTPCSGGRFFQHRLSGVLELRKRVRPFPGGEFFAEPQRGIRRGPRRGKRVDTKVSTLLTPTSFWEGLAQIADM